MAVETALCVPFVLLFLFCAIDIWQHLTVKYRVEAAAVSLAEVLVNEPAKRGEAPWDAISKTAGEGGATWLALANDIIDADDNTTNVGIQIAYSGSASVQADPISHGLACAGISASDLLAGLGSRNLKTTANQAEPDYLLAVVCREGRPRLSSKVFPKLSEKIFPKQLRSRFIALRRDWRWQ